ncbi:hypothetical protein ACK4CS_12710 [Enterococcus gallinarum]|uniref:Uncharacterized protein n=1 Tax=Enterococcus gallinarum TaxID=1353 RepID=A0AAE4HTU0_ENTGA|nr:hypothetical protein [Enterococcus gallinarum]MDT2691515.1 hypothetical protein [Enterococcus gallinarum]
MKFKNKSLSCSIPTLLMVSTIAANMAILSGFYPFLLVIIAIMFTLIAKLVRE